ncbi:hypothetical protein YC2023_019609 [Brassica napus]|uniref:Uncharacterized protein n=2 Tax=Brassica TaxID=3705 RepID=A0A0D2ZPE0_BRAOL|nr:unnamed protein product [Brassica napus]
MNEIIGIQDSIRRLTNLVVLNLSSNIKGATEDRVEAELHGDGIGWVSWGTTMVTNLVGFGRGSADGRDKNHRELHFYHNI